MNTSESQAPVMICFGNSWKYISKSTSLTHKGSSMGLSKSMVTVLTSCGQSGQNNWVGWVIVALRGGAVYDCYTVRVSSVLLSEEKNKRVTKPPNPRKTTPNHCKRPKIGVFSLSSACRSNLIDCNVHWYEDIIRIVAFSQIILGSTIYFSSLFLVHLFLFLKLRYPGDTLSRLG